MPATKDQVAQLIVSEAQRRNHTRDECLAEMSALYQESEWDETVWDPTNTTYGVAQQDASYPNRFDGASAQVKAFFDKLDIKRSAPGRGDIWLNICWLQQAPNWPSAQYWLANGRKAYLAEIKSRISVVTPYLDKLWPIGGPAMPEKPTFTEVERWCGNYQGRAGRKPDLFLIHSWEGVVDRDPNVPDAVEGADWLQRTKGTNNPVSYHYVVSQDNGKVTVADVVDTDYASWSVGNSNNRAINLCFAGSFVSWSRERWLQWSAAIDVAAYLAVQDCKKYGIPAKVLTPPSYGPPGGISDHKYCGQYLKDGNNHTDVGDNFPWDFFSERVARWAGDREEWQEPEPQQPTPIRVGPADDQLTLRWNCLGGRTLVEAVAQIRDKVCGTSDRDKTGVVTESA
ncbi:N-acetylmuramoyl-L-alanine amidase [Segniliparus rugosus]|uniref:N-acetylmuramoyl-L-alanine amidase domain-containing protein n=1 Tax=Segniliparus rugosus (strain ATCC BAA-974 / DSM 45345 / CCUG 50838 / CIP 108380 / JCM 13579 / CDC 945) TaxID=679197 RepID=E5XRT9_SEGRC|nr:N-acetylmuramoyl-L-alanine amidase [Segniliparus rugosus]EFV12954.1 hypothetical protein HMPREF9336_02211 [Segniliparus rugosus ATCC BAA-974]